MANIKDLFGNFRTQKVLSSASLNDLDPQLESANWIKSTMPYLWDYLSDGEIKKIIIEYG